ncbi:MAG TPA: condensation domain-containing protein, partial [Chitinophagaceae bacterium]|nr:condensation domain-containing protein [Chitinophagaceae bacterium]
QVVNRAYRHGYDLQPRDLFIHQTIGGLALLITERRKTASYTTSEQGILTGSSGLLPIQQWFFEEEQQTYDHYNQSVLLSLSKHIDTGTLRKAATELLRQHDALRFNYQHASGGWRQSYADDASLDIAHIVSSYILEGDTDDALLSSLEQIANACQQGLDIEEGKLVRFALLHTPDSTPENRLLIVVHHLAIDGVSWRILLEDLELLLDSFMHGRPMVHTRKTSSYRQWYNALQEYGESRRLQLQSGYWEQAATANAKLPVDKGQNEVVRNKDIRILTSLLDASFTSNLLHQIPKVYHTEINDVLLAALARTIGQWSGLAEVVIGLEGHGREAVAKDIDTSRTIGWFTTLYPVKLQSGAGKGPGDHLRSVKEELRRITDKGIGYGVLKYINRHPGLQAKANWEIAFNYLGQLDNAVKDKGLLQPAEGSAGQNTSPAHVTGHKLELNSYVSQGTLVMNWNYSSAHYMPSTIELLAENYLSNLRLLISHCLEQGAIKRVSTPSDYGLGTEVSIEELDRFLEEENTDNIMSF